ncbi:uncharacterized protein LOC134221650 [Armigeres subalbatus]|uniref:uncharacterized protein LOC134221650 n=1 Tax=Armigeres subalbatus TaxID=124917 RepID=UPI002ED28E10
MSSHAEMGDLTISPSNCPVCDRPDSAEDMVACDGCQSWYHYSCAEVDASVADQPWQCTSCGILNRTPVPSQAIRKADSKKGGKRLTVPVNTGKSNTSVASKGASRKSKKSAAGDNVSLTSSAKARLELELKMIDEQDCIKEQELQAELEMKNKKLLLAKQNRDRELALEAKRIAEEKAFEEKKLEEEDKGRKALLEMRRLSLEAKKCIVRQFSQRGSEVSSVSGSVVTNSKEKVRSWLQKSGEQTEVDKKSTPAAESINNVLEKADQDEFGEAFGVSRKTRTHNPNEDVACGVASAVVDNQEHYSPTSRQLAARQVMGKDLPTFSGNPEEWPIWISNFERSTVTCGFSMDENLIRLQRSLKGPAMETVRCRLLSPASVPHVIKTLQMRYGRPETLIRALTEKIQQLPPPKMDNLESIVDFGLAVDSLVEHLKTAKQQAHLANPSLLHDLVAKLPVDYRMKWSAYKSTIPIVNLGTFGSFMTSLVELAYDIMDDKPSTKASKAEPKPKDRSFIHAHAETTSAGLTSNKSTSASPVKKVCAACKKEGHKVTECFTFNAMKVAV